MSESRVMWATSVPSLYLVFLGLCSRVRPDVRDRQTSDVSQKHRLMSPPYGGGGIIMFGDIQLRLLEVRIGVGLSFTVRNQLSNDSVVAFLSLNHLRCGVLAPRGDL